ncbi:helix-turn-helix transcriptional regulator [Actinokineospora auranticolor]|uniref:PadR family transcriptional regulator n=1 Tax=Actinokineospora auranticolor TaxID=155976 RepID=A0A2S6GYA8_9PSEU|nr:helix-turn-helix transcriptional regulator [Actinokineospora auranticolor]PPK70214.1 PadR family transcriptional regulator [Actinokineospora auranticolor]
MTPQVRTVLAIFLANPDKEHFGLDLIAATGLLSGTVYPILARLERAGWLRSRTVELNHDNVGRRARRFFRLSPEGLTQASLAVETTERITEDRQAELRTRLLAEAQSS